MLENPNERCKISVDRLIVGRYIFSSYLAAATILFSGNDEMARAIPCAPNAFVTPEGHDMTRVLSGSRAT